MELFNKAAECKTLGCIMVDNSLLDEAGLTEEDFYDARNKILISAMHKLNSSGKEINLVTLPDVLGDKLNDVGLGYIMTDLNVVTTALFNSSLEIVKRESARRKAESMARKILGMLEKNEELDTLVAESQKMAMSLNSREECKDIDSISDILIDTMDNILENGGKEFAGIESGFTMLDRMLSGLQKSDLIILAARPAMGKTAFALNVASNVAREHTVVVFSLEMSKRQLCMRMISSLAKKTTEQIRNMINLSDDEQNEIYSAVDSLSSRNLHIVDKSGLTVAGIRSAIRQIKHKVGNVDLVVIDYLQLIRGDAKHGREQEVSEISRSLKGIARDFDVPVICLSQLSRTVESRQVKEPMLSDLRESGAIEQDADIVIFLYRDEYYNPEDTEYPKMAKVIISKHRGGEIGSFMTYFDGETTTFGNLLQEEI